MSGSHYAPEPERDARYDCRTLTEQERDDVAALRARLEAQDARIAALEANLAHHADVLQVHELKLERAR